MTEHTCPTHPEWPDDFEEDKWYYAPDAALGVFRVDTVDMEYDEAAERCQATLDVLPLNDEPATLTAVEVRNLGLPDDVFRVPSRVLREPGQILAEFAAEEITNYTIQLGITHPYNGLDGVETIRDIVVADILWGWAQRSDELLPPDLGSENHEPDHRIIATEPVWVESALTYDHEAEDFTDYTVRELEEIVQPAQDGADYRCTCGDAFQADFDAARAHLHDKRERDQPEGEP